MWKDQSIRSASTAVTGHVPVESVFTLLDAKIPWTDGLNELISQVSVSPRKRTSPTMRSLFLWVLLFAILALASAQEGENSDGANAGDANAPDATTNVPVANPALAAVGADTPVVLPSSDEPIVPPGVQPVTVVQPAPGVPSPPLRFAVGSSSSGSSNSETVRAPVRPSASSADDDSVGTVKPSAADGNATASASPAPTKKSDAISVTVTTLPMLFATSAIVFAAW